MPTSPSPFRSCLIPAVLLLVSAATLPAADAPAPRKIVLIAGKKGHGAEGNRIHDFPWCIRLLKVLIERSNIAAQARVEIHFNGWPKDPAALQDAATVMVLSEGRDRKSVKDEAPHLQDDARVAEVEALVKRGCGMMAFHYATFGPDERAEQIFRWVGGYFDWDENGKWYSALTTKETDVQLALPDHPVLRGVKPFRMRDEFYYNMRFKPNDPCLRPLWVVPALGGRAEHGNLVTWAVEREDGGRGFSTTCGHFYDNWKHDDFRTTLLNAIAWTAKIEVPAGGVVSPYLERDEIAKALGLPAPDPGVKRLVAPIREDDHDGHSHAAPKTPTTTPGPGNRPR